MIKSIKCKDNIIYNSDSGIKDFRLLIDNKNKNTSIIIDILIDNEIEDVEINENSTVNIKVDQRIGNKTEVVIKPDIQFGDIINEFLETSKISNVAYVYEDEEDITHICPIR